LSTLTKDPNLAIRKNLEMISGLLKCEKPDHRGALQMFYEPEKETGVLLQCVQPSQVYAIASKIFPRQLSRPTKDGKIA
jgi:hypothetical protein